VRGAGVPTLHRIRWVFPSLQSRISPQSSGKFKKPGFSGQALASASLNDSLLVKRLGDRARPVALLPQRPPPFVSF
jgi:hypothetical protein